MNIFKRRKPSPTKTTEERLARAQQEHEEQLKKFEKEQQMQDELKERLANNHLAELMYEALSARRGESG